MSVVLFLGAGFSAAFDLPVMRSFLTTADRSSRITDDERKLLAKLLLDARGANAFLESSSTNIEDILSFYQMGERLGLSEAGEAQALRRIIGRIYSEPGDMNKYNTRYDRVAQFLRRLVRPPDKGGIQRPFSFITTNYDINIEVACHRLGVQIDYGFSVESPPVDMLPVVGHLRRPIVSTRGAAIGVFKLHGSVNWWETDTGVAADERIVPIRTHSGESGAIPLCCASNPFAHTPLLIPPSFLKPELRGPLGAVWGRAATALSTAVDVVFVGYSFPPSDTEMMYFLARAFAKNSSLRQILIVDPNAAAIIYRLQTPESRAGSHFRDLLASRPQTWESMHELDI